MRAWESLLAVSEARQFSEIEHCLLYQQPGNVPKLNPASRQLLVGVFLLADNWCKVTARLAELSESTGGDAACRWVQR